MDAFDLEELRTAREASGRAYHEFLRVPSLSAGIYALPAGGTDPQQPHGEDEVYVVLGGRATVWVGEEDRRVEPGATVFVAAGVEHRFHTIEEDLELLVVFAPPEGSA